VDSKLRGWGWVLRLGDFLTRGLGDRGTRRNGRGVLFLAELLKQRNLDYELILIAETTLKFVTVKFKATLSK